MFKDPETELLSLEPEFPTLGAFPQMLEAFLAIAERWLGLADVPAVQRIAFGAALVHPEPDRRSGYLRLPDYVPVQVDPESSDFLFQINPPALASGAGIEGLLINRLSKWLVATFRFLPVRFTGTDLRTTPTAAIYALRLELDINTVPTFTGPVPRENLIQVFRELIAAGQAIATNGANG